MPSLRLLAGSDPCRSVADGYGDYLTVPNFPYAADATFSLGFWLTKERCTPQEYEFIFSHSERPAVNSQVSPQRSVPDFRKRPKNMPVGSAVLDAVVP